MQVDPFRFAQLPFSAMGGPMGARPGRPNDFISVIEDVVDELANNPTIDAAAQAQLSMTAPQVPRMTSPQVDPQFTMVAPVAAAPAAAAPTAGSGATFAASAPSAVVPSAVVPSAVVPVSGDEDVPVVEPVEPVESARAAAQAGATEIPSGAGDATEMPSGSAAQAIAAAKALDPDAKVVVTPQRNVAKGSRSARAIHVTQVKSKFNPKAVEWARDCGPASVVMALRKIGLAIPGAPPNAQRQIDRARTLALGAPAKDTRGMSTTNLQLKRALEAAGAKSTETQSWADIEAAVKAGRPVILHGNPRNPGAYGHQFGAAQMTPYDGPHWITVSGVDASGKFIINDPLSKSGPVKVSRSALQAYPNSDSLGIIVER